MGDEKKEDTRKFVKQKLLMILSGIFLFFILFRFSVYSETPAPDPGQTPELPESTPTVTASPETVPPTEEITASPTPSLVPTEPATTAPSENPGTPTPTPTPEPVPPTEIGTPTAEITASPTPTPELQFLYGFTAPPLYQEESGGKTARPDHTPKPTANSASIGIVQVENIGNTERGFRWSDLIKYAEYLCYVLAGLAIVYGVVCLVGLLCFNKDLSIGAIRKKRKDARRDGKK